MRRLIAPENRTRTAVLGSAMLAVAGFGTWAWLSGAAAESWASVSRSVDATIVESTASIGIRLRQVSVEGRERTRSTDILGAVDLPQGAPLMAFDPQAARERLESLTWVKEAVVERRLPDAIHIRLIERTPIALWQRDSSSFVLIDADGALIEDNISAFAHLPVIAGPGAPEAASDLFTMLAVEPDLRARVRAAVRVGQRRWNIWLDDIGDNGIDVRLPEHDPERALARLAQLEREQRILRRDLTMIDLRMPDRLIVEVAETADGTREKKMKDAPRRAPLPLSGPAQDA